MRRRLAKLREAIPVLLDVAGFTALVVGAALIWPPLGWLTAGAALIVLGLRAQTPPDSHHRR